MKTITSTHEHTIKEEKKTKKKFYDLHVQETLSIIHIFLYILKYYLYITITITIIIIYYLRIHFYLFKRCIYYKIYYLELWFIYHRFLRLEAFHLKAGTLTKMLKNQTCTVAAHHRFQSSCYI